MDAVQVYFDDGSLGFCDIPFEKLPVQFKNITEHMSSQEWSNLEATPYNRLVMGSRPWKCEAHVYMLPPWLQADAPRQIFVRSVEKSFFSYPVSITLEQFYFKPLLTSDLIFAHTALPASLFPSLKSTENNLKLQYASSVFGTQWRFDILVARPITMPLMKL